MDEARLAELMRRAERNRYFLELEQAAKKARYAKPKPPREPYQRKPYQRKPRDQWAERPGRPAAHTKCTSCGRPFRSRTAKVADAPGTVRHDCGGLCMSCNKARKRMEKS
jgi:hypothetical protein